MSRAVRAIVTFTVLCGDRASSVGAPAAQSCLWPAGDKCEDNRAAVSEHSQGLFQRSALVPRKALITRSPNDSVELPSRQAVQPDHVQTPADSNISSMISRLLRRMKEILRVESVNPVGKLGVFFLVPVVVVTFLILWISCGLSCWSRLAPKQSGPEAAADELARLEVAREALLAKLDTLDTQLSALHSESAAFEAAEAEDAAGATDPAIAEAEANTTAHRSASDELIRTASSALLAQAEGQISTLRRTSVRDVSADVSAKAEGVRVVVTEAIQDARASAEAFVYQTASTSAEAVQEAFVADVQQEEVAEFRHSMREAVAPLLGMPAPLLFAGLLAPLQLQAMCSLSWLMVGLQVPALVLLGAAVAMDFGKPCGDMGELWIWSVGALTISGVSLALRCWVLVGTRRAMDDVRGHRNPSGSDGHSFHDGLHLKDIVEVVSMSSAEYFKPLLAYDGLAQARLYTLLNVLSCLSLLWGFAGVTYMMLEVTFFLKAESCEATTMRVAAHVIGFIYVACMLWLVASIACWAILSALTSESLAMSALRAAVRFDETYSYWNLPVATILLRGTLLRNAHDTMVLESSTMFSDLQQLRREKAALDVQENALGGDLADAKKRLLDSERRMERQNSLAEIAESCSQKVAYVLDGAAIVAVAATSEQAAEMAADARSSLADAGSRAAQRSEEVGASSSSRAAALAEVGIDGVQRSAFDLALSARQQLIDAGLDTPRVRQAVGDLAVQALAEAEALGVDVRELAQALASSRTPRANGAGANGGAVPGG